MRCVHSLAPPHCTARRPSARRTRCGRENMFFEKDHSRQLALCQHRLNLWFNTLFASCFLGVFSALLPSCARTVINDEESMSVISQCASSPGIDDSEAPMLDDDITAWSEFKAMRDMIQGVGALSNLNPKP